jgi:DNA (cytosine-5)-methyltransferase 1
MDQQLTVHDAAGLIGVSSDTIRRWEKKGLIKAYRTKNNYRTFDIKEIKRMHSKQFSDSDDIKHRVLQNKKKSGFNVVELFAGAGGTALGFENAGLDHTLLVEWDKHAVATLRKNKPKWNVLEQDISSVDFSSYKADIVEGGFPCQSFSYAGKKMGFDDIRGTMFFEFARCIKEIKPKIAMGENVRGLLRHEDGRTLDTMISILEEIGYRVAYKLHRSQYLDVPQKRERLVILAVRKDLDIPFLFPKENNYIIPIRAALKDCPKSPGQQYPPRKRYILSKIPPGGYWRDLPLNLQKEYMMASYHMSGGKTGMARRLSWDEPSLTLTCAPAQKQTERCHPKETRPLTIREYARIQTFPDTWEFEGSMSSQYKQIGNAVPVNLGYHVGRCLIAMLDKTQRDEDSMIEVSAHNEELVSSQQLLFQV